MYPNTIFDFTKFTDLSFILAGNFNSSYHNYATEKETKLNHYSKLYKKKIVFVFNADAFLHFFCSKAQHL